MLKALVRAATAIALAAVLILPTFRVPAMAAPSWEINFAKKIDALNNPIFLRCGPTAWYGGRGAPDPHYQACFINNGDHMMARDLRADGDAAVIQWAFHKYVGGSQKYADNVTRRGACIYTGGSKPGHRSGSCNKDLPERGYLIIKAGKRIVSGSTRLRDMRFGGSTCLMISGNSNLQDTNCLYAP